MTRALPSPQPRVPTGDVHIAGASVRGPTHARLGTPNQDRFGWLPTSRTTVPLVVAVADGHGSARCFRSDRGAELAVSAATTAGLAWQARQTGQLPESETGRANLPEAIVSAWCRAVDADARANPIRQDELHAASAEGMSAVSDAAGTPTRLAYGSTLLTAILTAHDLVLMQIGDGDILCVGPDRPPWRPLGANPIAAGLGTDSLCLNDAAHRARTATLHRRDFPVELVLLSTDGFVDAYADEAAYLRVGSDLVRRSRDNGFPAVSAQLGGWLEQAAGYSGDDVTAAVIWWGSADRP